MSFVATLELARQSTYMRILRTLVVCLVYVPHGPSWGHGALQTFFPPNSKFVNNTTLPGLIMVSAGRLSYGAGFGSGGGEPAN